MIEDTPKLNRTWNGLLGIKIGNNNFWIDRHEIPIGTLLPYESYDKDENGKAIIPMCDIVTTPFDPVNMPDTERELNNTLLLGGSGDGKTLIIKNNWFFRQKAGNRCLFFDSVGTESGRAKKEWDSDRIAPFTKGEGIPLVHVMPEWAMANMEQLRHNFITYATRLDEIESRENWQCLGMTEIASVRVANIIKSYVEENKKITMKELKNALYELRRIDEQEEEKLNLLPRGSFDNAMRVLTSIEDSNVVSDDAEGLDLEKHWKDVNSICISYNNESPILQTFDVGFQIQKCAKINRKIDESLGRRTPIFVILDDPKSFVDANPLIKFNIAIDMIQKIGFNLRKFAVGSLLSVQSLKIVDEKVASAYPTKIISPLFQNVDQLASINIPPKAIQYLKSGVLLKDRKNHLLQWLLITKDGEVIPFFPFTPSCQHFKEVYFEKKSYINEETTE